VDWIEFLINHRKASLVIKGHTPAIDPRMRQMESFAKPPLNERLQGLTPLSTHFLSDLLAPRVAGLRIIK
jgi:hypothetical protein